MSRKVNVLKTKPFVAISLMLDKEIQKPKKVMEARSSVG